MELFVIPHAKDLLRHPLGRNGDSAQAGMCAFFMPGRDTGQGSVGWLFICDVVLGLL